MSFTQKLASILHVAGAKEISAIKVGQCNTLLRLTPGPENIEKPDVAALERNYNIVFGVMDLLKCDVPTACAFRNAIKIVDKDHDFALTHRMKTSDSKRAWYHYEGEKMHRLIGHANRHFTSKKNRDSIPSTMKLILLKELWRKHKSELFPIMDKKAPALAIEDAEDNVANDAELVVPKDFLDDYPESHDTDCDADGGLPLGADHSSGAENISEGEDCIELAPAVLESSCVNASSSKAEDNKCIIEEIMVASSSDEDIVDKETEAVWTAPVVRSTLIVPKPATVAQVLEKGILVRAVDPKADQVKGPPSKRTRVTGKTNAVAIKPSALAKSHPIASHPKVKPNAVGVAAEKKQNQSNLVQKQKKEVDILTDSFKPCHTHIVRRTERGKSMHQLNGKMEQV